MIHSYKTFCKKGENQTIYFYLFLLKSIYFIEIINIVQSSEIIITIFKRKLHSSMVAATATAANRDAACAPLMPNAPLVRCLAPNADKAAPSTRCSRKA